MIITSRYGPQNKNVSRFAVKTKGQINYRRNPGKTVEISRTDVTNDKTVITLLTDKQYRIQKRDTGKIRHSVSD